jgi:hypothetical protein
VSLSGLLWACRLVAAGIHWHTGQHTGHHPRRQGRVVAAASAGMQGVRTWPPKTPCVYEHLQALYPKKPLPCLHNRAGNLAHSCSHHSSHQKQPSQQHTISPDKGLSAVVRRCLPIVSSLLVQGLENLPPDLPRASYTPAAEPATGGSSTAGGGSNRMPDTLKRCPPPLQEGVHYRPV